MATTVIPVLIDALVTQATTALPNVNVFDGYGVTDDPGDFLMVGVEDPDATDSASSADSSQSAATMGTPRTRDETGSISCVALSWNGNADQKAARDAVFAITEAVASLCRSNPSLGVAAGGLVVTGFGADQRLLQNQDENGTEAAVIFTISFRARI